VHFGFAAVARTPERVTSDDGIVAVGGRSGSVVENRKFLAGGFSGEYAVSLRSAAGLLSWIDRSRFTPYLIVIEHEQSPRHDGSGWAGGHPHLHAFPPGGRFSVKIQGGT